MIRKHADRDQNTLGKKLSRHLKNIPGKAWSLRRGDIKFVSAGSSMLYCVFGVHMYSLFQSIASLATYFLEFKVDYKNVEIESI